MSDVFMQCLWKNFGAVIDMLKNAIVLCPDELWHKDKKFFYLTYHTTIFLDYYLTNPARNFHPALTYTIIDTGKLPPEAIDDVIPDEFYSRQEMLNYIASIRKKCSDLISGASQEKLTGRWIEQEEINLHGLCPSVVENYSLLEILFYNFRHVQHHVGQLNLLLRQRINMSPDWVLLIN